jgi:hypothetical protein
VKDAIRKKDDEFDLCWYNDPKDAKITIPWNIQKHFIPDNFSEQLKNNQINLRKKWLILDEFCVFEINNYFHSFLV